MKKIILLSILAVFAISCNNTNAEPPTFTEKMQAATIDNPRYEMIQTDNIHILLKWDTRTGQVWMVQYGLGDKTTSMESIIPRSNILPEKSSWNGRFNLYPTKNMYNFILIDTFEGTTYQVQWNTKNEYCFTLPIVQ